MITKTRRIVGLAVFVALFCLWGILFSVMRNNSLVVFPLPTFEIYTLTDNEAQGYSTSEVTVADSLVSAKVNVRSGKAYPYAGVGFNLMSVNSRPSGYFDFARYDSLSITVTAGRMRSVSLRILTDDPKYSRTGKYLSYRPLETSVPVSSSFSEIKKAIADFKTAEWWLAAQGLEKDDNFLYLSRTALFEVFNGDGALRGIPDDIEIKQIKIWGENRNFTKGMFFTLGVIAIAFVYFICVVLRKPKNADAMKKKMDRVAKLLKMTDKSIAEIAISVGEKNPAKLEREFFKIYGKKPLTYRKQNV